MRFFFSPGKQALVCTLLLWAAGMMMCMHAIGQGAATVMHRYYNNFEDSTLNSTWMNSNTIVLTGDSTGNHCSRTDKNHNYSSGIEIPVPDDLKRNNFRISLSAMIRIFVAGAKTQLVISVSDKDSSIYWTGSFVPDSSVKPGIWSACKVEALIPRNIPVSSTIKIFLWNSTGDFTVDLDEFGIQLTEVKFPSYLPQ